MNRQEWKSGHVLLWRQQSRQLLLHAPVRPKHATVGTINLCVIKDICNPEKWAVALQTDSGIRVISVHNSRGWATAKVMRMKCGLSVELWDKAFYKPEDKELKEKLRWVLGEKWAQEREGEKIEQRVHAEIRDESLSKHNVDVNEDESNVTTLNENGDRHYERESTHWYNIKEPRTEKIENLVDSSITISNLRGPSRRW